MPCISSRKLTIWTSSNCAPASRCALKNRPGLRLSALGLYVMTCWLKRYDDRLGRGIENLVRLGPLIDHDTRSTTPIRPTLTTGAIPKFSYEGRDRKVSKLSVRTEFQSLPIDFIKGPSRSQGRAASPSLKLLECHHCGSGRSNQTESDECDSVLFARIAGARRLGVEGFGLEWLQFHSEKPLPNRSHVPRNRVSPALIL